MNFKRCGRKWLWLNLRYYPSMSGGNEEKDEKPQDSWCGGRVSNWTPPE
jgi:hypothetical protein